ncbi:alpha/beta fold hydrolase [Streptomyces sp. NPDC059161]|uniref:alpha/beta fold hydrolase n=1 Tax=Streptomyces sp. NPDC059161 TaxID=3346749 RepID=UPI0036A0CF77
MPLAKIGTSLIHYVDTGGDGPVVVFSHGNLMDADMWQPQLTRLAPAFRCVAWDTRLHGRTEDEGVTHTYWDSAADLLALLDELDVDRGHLVGHSQGGFTSLRAALLAPTRVASLTLIDTAAGSWPPQALADMAAVRDALRGSGPDAVGPALLELLLGVGELYPTWLAKWRSQPVERLAQAVGVLMAVDDITSRLAEVRAPALVVHGTEDRPIPISEGRSLAAALPAATFVPIPGAGHTPSLTHPDRVHEPMTRFVNSVCQ